MAKWTIVYTDGQIIKDEEGYNDLDLSFLPSTILNVQSPDGVTCEIEYGDRALEENSSNDSNVATSSLSWWNQVDTVWAAGRQAAIDAEAAETAAAEAAAEGD